MNLAYLYPTIYWNCACLISDSGSLNPEAATDYKKMARAISNTRKIGVKVMLPDINRAAMSFVLDNERNEIVYGLKGLMNVGKDVVDLIIQNRPYKSLDDFMDRVKINRQPMLSLIKGGAFDSLEPDRESLLKKYIWKTSNKKKRITLQNLRELIKKDLIPKNEEFQISRTIFEFNRYLKDRCKVKNDTEFYHLDIRAINFLVSSANLEDMIDGNLLEIKNWDTVYQEYMNVFRNWIKENQEQILNTLNRRIFLEAWNKDAQGNISAWEMEALCFYYHEHELTHINKNKYGIVDFNMLLEKPQIDRIFTKGGKTINLYKIYKICGTCIAKDKNKATISLLTATGDVVDVKFRKEHFSLFDKQISEMQPNGSKKVIDKSWFTKGNKLIIQGIRQGENFVAKKYGSTSGHTLYKIIKVLPNGELILQGERNV